MGKRDGSRAKSHRISCRGQLGVMHTELRVGYWNCNGINDESKQQDIVEAMEKGHLYIMFVDETHLKRGGNEDMSAFNPWNPMFIERGFGLKKGGGKLVLTSKRLKWTPWDPSQWANEWIGSERIWILIHNNRCKVALCSVYMAAEVTTNNDFMAWNDSLYEALQGELRTLELEGYQCMIMGDMNAHVGAPPRGIAGNRQGVNTNGIKLLNFVDNNDSVLMNKEENVCTGLFTRITPQSCSILDYVLATQDIVPKGKRMVIDEEGRWCSGSDHVGIRVDITLEKAMVDEGAHVDKGVFLRQDRDVSIAMRVMDKAIEDTDWEGLTLDEMGRRIQEILVSSNIEAYGNVQLGGRRHKNRPLKRLRQAKRLADREQSKL